MFLTMNSYGQMLTKKAIVIMLYYTNESFPCSSALPSMFQIIERFRIHDFTCKSFHMYSDSWQEFPVWTTKVKIPFHFLAHCYDARTRKIST